MSILMLLINSFFSFSDLSTSRSLKQLMDFNTFSIRFLSLIQLCTSIIRKKLDVIFLIQWLSISFEQTLKKIMQPRILVVAWLFCHSSSSSPPKIFQVHLHPSKLSKLVCTPHNTQKIGSDVYPPPGFLAPFLSPLTQIQNYKL